MKTNDLMQIGLMKIATQMQTDWLQQLRHGYAPQAGEPLHVSILPRKVAPRTPLNLFAERGSAADVLASLNNKLGVKTAAA